MAAYSEQLGDFDKEKEDLKAYTKRFEQFIEVNVVTDDKKVRAIFFSTVGAQSYKLLKEGFAQKSLKFFSLYFAYKYSQIQI